jgi:hypothetical protein
MPLAELETMLEAEPELELESVPTKTLLEYVGGLSAPSKMPGWAYSLPAEECSTGARLRTVSGSVCSGCYALKGRYMFPGVQRALYRRLAAIAKPHWTGAMAELIRRKTKREPHFRWHDSGDIQSLEHMRAIARVAELTPNVRHWLPSREYRLVREYLASENPPANLNIRLSAHMLGGKAPRFPGLAVTVSTVSKGEPPKGAHRCPAPKQGNICGSCRACWDPSVPHVDYAYH